MSELGKFIAFQAAVSLIQSRDIMDYWMRWQKNARSLEETKPTFVNHVKKFTKTSKLMRFPLRLLS